MKRSEGINMRDWLLTVQIIFIKGKFVQFAGMLEHISAGADWATGVSDQETDIHNIQLTT